MTRTFTDSPAVRDKVPLLIGLAGPSGGGKTFSALRLATGIQRVTGGDVYGIDTESKRMCHYADKFKFRHVPFVAPFGALDYLAAIEHCHKKGAGVIVIDSMSHEHEGPGGCLEVHREETERLAKLWRVSESKAQLSAWSLPKGNRRRLLNSILQIPCNFIFCFRAKEKLKIVRGEDPRPLGFMPIAGEEFVFDMTVNGLLMPGAGGVPTWNPQESGEKTMVKLPEQFRDLLLKHNGPLDERLGEEMAKWAAGTTTAKLTVKIVESQLLACRTKAEVLTVRAGLKGKQIGDCTKDDAKFLKDLGDRLERDLPETVTASEDESEAGEASEGGRLFGETETDLSALHA